MEVEGAVALDDKAKRMRDLLSSFYSPDQSSSASLPSNTSSRFATLDTINTASFDADQYMKERLLMEGWPQPPQPRESEKGNGGGEVKGGHEILASGGGGGGGGGAELSRSVKL